MAPDFSSRLDQAQSRRTLVQSLEQIRWVASGWLLFAAVVLLAGAWWLSSWVFLVLAVASIAFVAYKVQQGRRNHYWLAQQIDQKLGFKDEISTACHFQTDPRPLAVALQQTAADRLATVSLDEVFPLPNWMMWRLPVALLALVLGLFAWRYWSLDSLDLQDPLLAVNAETQQQISQNEPKKTPAQRLREQLKQMGMPLEQLEGVLGWSPEGADSKDAGQKGESSANGQQQMSSQQGKPSEKTDGSSMSAENSDQMKNQPPSANQENAQKNNEAQNGGQQNQQNQKSESLLDKMREALASMNEKPPQQNQKNQQKEQQGQQSQSQQNQQPQQDQQDPSQQGNQQGQQQAASPKEQAGQQQGQQAQNKSGQGSSDGDKTLKEERRQDQAMAKISEILGKRAENVSGEMQMKTSSKFNRLATRYVEGSGREAASDLSQRNREEIPLEQQAYIKRYFAQLQAEQKSTPKAEGKPSVPAP
jgi:hypothetical protein